MNSVRVSFCTALVCAFFLFIGCTTVHSGSSSQKNQSLVKLSGISDTANSAAVSPAAVGNNAGTPLAVPTKEQLKKNNMDSAVLGYLETGSPDSIRMAVERINADSRGMTDANRIGLAVAGELMKTLYPAEPMNWSIPAVPETGSYIAAIRSAQMGVYDYNTGSNDFFSLVLPSLVLLISTTPGEYYTDAQVSLQKAASLNNKSVLPPYFLALIAERQGKISVADDFYKNAWNLDSSCYPAGIGYIQSLIRKGNGTAALDVSRILVSRYPDSVRFLQLCAESAFAMKDWNAADPYVLKVLKLEPANTTFLLMRARILVERKEYLKANSLIDAFGTTNRTDKNYLLLRSRVVREWNKNLVMATSILQEAQQLYPEDIDVLLSSAEVCYQASQTINSLSGRDFVTQVLKKDPANKTALSLLVSDYINGGEWQNAVKNGEQLVSMYPGDDSRALLLRSYLGSLQVERAVTLAKTLYSVPNPADEIVSLYLQALVESGDFRTASGVISARMNDSSSSFKSVLYYYESRLTSDSDRKLSSLRSSLLADPRNTLGLFAMYQWYLDKADYRKAQYYLKQVIALDPANKKYTQLLANLDSLLAR